MSPDLLLPGYAILPVRFRESGRFEALPLSVASFPALRGNKRILQEVEDPDALTSVP